MDKSEENFDKIKEVLEHIDGMAFMADLPPTAVQTAKANLIGKIAYQNLQESLGKSS